MSINQITTFMSYGLLALNAAGQMGGIDAHTVQTINTYALPATLLFTGQIGPVDLLKSFFPTTPTK